MKNIFDALQNIKKQIETHVKGDVTVEFTNDVIYATISNAYILDDIVTSCKCPYNQLLLEIGQSNAADQLYHSYKYKVEKLLFKWYD